MPYVLDTIGITQVMYASDYRHWDSEFPESVRKLKGISELNKDQQRHVLGENAVQWFGLTPDDLPVG